MVMEISASMVKDLREKTGVGMMQCKKALQETGGDMNAAIDYLRKKGEETAGKRAGRATKEGKIATHIETNIACIGEINSETDFVARNADFTGFVENLLPVIAKEKCETIDALLAKKLPNGILAKDALNDIIAKIGEKISIRRFERIEYDATKAQMFSYIHGGGKIGVLLLLGADTAQGLQHADFQALGKDLTLQIAAANPLAITCEGLDKNMIEKEKEIYRTQVLNEGKHEKIVDKIVQGKMAKYFKEVCLLDQPFVKDNEKSVKDIIAQVEKGISSKISVIRFVRYLLGSEG
jgi:elongation factor Ts